MKVNIGPYKRWFGPYQLAEMLCFWVPEVKDKYGMRVKPDWVHNFGEWLAHGSIEPDPVPGEVRSFSRTRKTTILYRFLIWVDSKKKRKIKVKIHNYDVWSMDETLAHIITPMLRKLREVKVGAPYVEDEDVPEHLRTTAAPPLTEEQKNVHDVDDNHFARWYWVLDEIIFAFESVLDKDWEEQFSTGEIDFAFKYEQNGMSQLIRGTNHTRVTDWEARREYEKRINNGFRLFGKYYQALWW
jgi:hypothetical protein